jgi:hypothetical protein
LEAQVEVDGVLDKRIMSNVQLAPNDLIYGPRS